MNCKYCGNIIQTGDKRNKFCSAPCYKAYRRNHPEEFGQVAKTYSCSYCGKPGIKRTPSTTRENIYCSRECSNKAQSEALKHLPELRTSKGREIACENCGKMFFVKPYRAKTARFCSKVCAFAHSFGRPSLAKTKRDQNGRNNPNYKNGDNKTTARKYGKMILGSKCMICGFDYVTHVHHIIPRREGGKNSKDNLVILCPNHHAMADRNLISREELLTLNHAAIAQLSENQPLSHQCEVD